MCFPTLSNRNQHQTDSNSVLHLQIPKNILSISSRREKNFSCHWVYQRYYTCFYLPWISAADLAQMLSNWDELDIKSESAPLLLGKLVIYGENKFEVSKIYMNACMCIYKFCQIKKYFSWFFMIFHVLFKILKILLQWHTLKSKMAN